MFDALQDVEDTVAKLVASEHPADLARLAKVRRRLDATWLRAVDDYARSEVWCPEFPSAAVAVRAASGLSTGKARHDVVTARKLRDFPELAHAFADGEIDRQRVDIITEAHTPGRANALRELEAALVDAAKLATPDELRALMLRITDALDGDDGKSRARRRRNDEYFHLSQTYGGMWALNGLLDPERGAKLQAALTEQLKRTTDTSRSPRQRRADALVSLCTSNLMVEMSVHVDLKDIEERGGTELAAEIRRTAPNLSKATLRRTACDCNISRVITDGPSQVLDVGRSSRVATAAQRRALEAKYGGCFFPGCDARFERCEIHHKHHWIDGGPTDLDNQVPVCGSHQWWLHERGGRLPP
jgi:hypothetical protein